MNIRRKTITALTNLAGWMHRHQRITLGDGFHKVNLGSGLKVAEGWLNVDAGLNNYFSRFPTFLLRGVYRFSGERENMSFDAFASILKNHRFIHHDIKFGLPFEDGSVDFVYSSHFVEHLPAEAGLSLMKEIHRVLRPRGRVRICVPDLAHAFRLYQEGKKEQALGYFFVPAHLGPLYEHKYMYDFELLQDKLKQAGFSNTERCAYQTGHTPDLHQLDNRPEETLYVEATKS